MQENHETHTGLEEKLQAALKTLSDYKEALDHAANIVVTDTRGIILEVNDNTCRGSGFSREELIGQHARINKSGYHPPAYYKTMWETISSGRVWKGEFKNRRKDGTHYWVDTTIVPLLDPDGKPERYLGVRYDITAQKKAQTLARHNEKRFRALVQNSADYIAVIDKSGTYTYLSPSLVEFLGDRPQSSFRAHALDYVHPDDRFLITDVLEQVSEQARIDTEPFRVRDMDNNWRWLQATVTNMLDDPVVEGVVINAREVTDSLRYNELVKLERFILEKLALNNPLELVLDWLIDGLQKLFADMRCSILQVKENRLQVLAAPDFSQNYHEYIAQLEIGRDKSSSALAAATRQRVIVGDIRNDPRWEKFWQFAENEGVRASWSHPVLDAQSSSVLALFTVYYNQAKEPNSYEQIIIERICELLRIVMTSRQKDETIRKQNEQFQYINKATSDIIYDWQIPQDRMECSDQLRNVTGKGDLPLVLTMGEFLELLHPDDREGVQTDLQRTIDDEQRPQWFFEYRILSERSPTGWLVMEENAYILRDEQGLPQRMIGVIHDITDRKNHENRLEESIREKEVLLAEIHHRVKNNLAVISGMMQLQAFDEENITAGRKLQDSMLRIQTMASIHDLLYRSENFSSLSFSEILKSLIENIEQVFLNDKHIGKELHIKPVPLNMNLAIPCALIINEVLTNCYKHAFRNQQTGHIKVETFCQGTNTTLRITDNGSGIPDSVNTESSLGLLIISTLAKQLKATYSYKSTGSGTAFEMGFRCIGKN